MFHNISSEIVEQMNELEYRDREEMSGQIPMKHFDKLRQIPPETGKFISLIAAISPKGRWIEYPLVQKNIKIKSIADVELMEQISRKRE